MILAMIGHDFLVARSESQQTVVAIRQLSSCVCAHRMMILIICYLTDDAIVCWCCCCA